MARIITDAEIPLLQGMEKALVYNGLDCTGTREVLDDLKSKFDGWSERCYGFERGLNAVAMTMMFRGILIDEQARGDEIARLEAEEQSAQQKLSSLVTDIWDTTERRKGKCTDGKTHKWPPKKDAVPEEKQVCAKCGGSRLVAANINPRSVPQIKKLVYTKLGLPKQHSRKDPDKITLDDEALEKLIEKFPAHAPVLECVVEARRVRKQIGFLKSKISADGRMRSSFNVGAAETDRWSSSKSPTGEGTNLQNVADRSRHIFVADPGFLLFYADLEQAESNVVAHDAEDEAYINAHLSTDVHTYVARLVWPELGWTGDDKKDREIAEREAPWDKDHEIRWYAKHTQHGTNIGMTPYGIARDAHISLAKAEDAQGRYFAAFPQIQARQRAIEAEVRTTGCLVHVLGRKRRFFDRVWDAATLRQAKAQTQQSIVAWLLNMALWRIWKEMDLKVNTLREPPRLDDPNRVWLLAQEHDAILGLVREGDAATLLRIKELMEIPVHIRGRVMTIRSDIKVGHNFRKFDARKPETVGGLAKWTAEPFRVYNTKEDLKHGS